MAHRRYSSASYFSLLFPFASAAATPFCVAHTFDFSCSNSVWFAVLSLSCSRYFPLSLALPRFHCLSFHSFSMIGLYVGKSGFRYSIERQTRICACAFGNLCQGWPIRRRVHRFPRLQFPWAETQPRHRIEEGQTGSDDTMWQQTCCVFKCPCSRLLWFSIQKQRAQGWNNAFIKSYTHTHTQWLRPHFKRFILNSDSYLLVAM